MAARTPQLTAARRRALEIIRDHGPIGPGVFAVYMWPDSPCWKKVYKCGNQASSRGIAMAYAAGGFLGKLRREDLITPPNWTMPIQYVLSTEGYRVLSECPTTSSAGSI